MQTFLPALLSYLVPAAAVALTCAVIAIATYAYQRALQALPSNVRVQIQALANTIVQAVEQKYILSDVDGTQKKQEAMRRMKQVAEKLGLKIDDLHASIAIEAAVYSLSKGCKQKGSDA